MTSQRAEQLIQQLGLQPHPEGGYYREVYRSLQTVQAFDPLETRSAVTTILFLLRAGQFSRLHRISSDEIWHYYEGDALELTWGALEGELPVVGHLGPVSSSQSPVLVVPANAWQAARTLGDYTLVGCTVAPGFEFRNFEMLRDLPDLAGQIADRYPALQGAI